MSRKGSSKATLLYIELLLWGAGVACAGYIFTSGLEAYAARHAAFGKIPQQQSSQGFQDAQQASSERYDKGGEENSSHLAPNVQVLGKLEIPKLSLSVPVMSNYDSNSLLRGVGHIEGTAMPGGLGTMGLAGHRDSYFRPLRRIIKGMNVDITDEEGTFHYRVDSTEIVTPEQVEVLNIHNRPELTLITCYPFDFIGAAPKRFIVHARLLSMLPDTLK